MQLHTYEFNVIAIQLNNLCYNKELLEILYCYKTIKGKSTVDHA